MKPVTEQEMENETDETIEPNKNEVVKMDWDFHLVIENISEDQSDELMDLIIEWVEKNNTHCGGGCSPVKGE